MTKHRIYEMSFARVYPLYIAKVQKKGRTKAEVDEIIRWLTGHSQKTLEKELSKNVAAVRYLVRYGDGSGAQSTLILQRTGEDTWTIVNHGAGDKLLAGKLREDYLKSKLKPAEFTNLLIKQNE